MAVAVAHVRRGRAAAGRQPGHRLRLGGPLQVCSGTAPALAEDGVHLEGCWDTPVSLASPLRVPVTPRWRPARHHHTVQLCRLHTLLSMLCVVGTAKLCAARRTTIELLAVSRHNFLRRNHGGVLFLDVRDSTGVLQAVSAPEVVIEPSVSPEPHKLPQDLLNLPLLHSIPIYGVSAPFRPGQRTRSRSGSGWSSWSGWPASCGCGRTPTRACRPVRDRTQVELQLAALTSDGDSRLVEHGSPAAHDASLSARRPYSTKRESAPHFDSDAVSFVFGLPLPLIQTSPDIAHTHADRILMLHAEPKCLRSAGDVELLVDDVTVLNTVAGSLPFPISAGEPGAEEAPREEMRLRHRILDLRC